MTKVSHFLKPKERIKHHIRNGIRANHYAFGFGDVYRHWDAAQRVNTYTDLAAISSWIDVVIGAEFVQATAANQPRYNSSNVSFNNLPAIDFHTNVRSMTITGGIPFGDTHTLAFIARASSINSNCNTLLCDGSSQSNGRIIMGGALAYATGIGVYSGTTNDIGGNVEDTNAHIVVLTSTDLIIDGVVDDSGNWNHVNAFSTLSMNPGSSGQTLLGQVSEMLFIRRKLSQADCVMLSDNINAKYAIY